MVGVGGYGGEEKEEEEEGEEEEEASRQLQNYTQIMTDIGNHEQVELDSFSGAKIYPSKVRLTPGETSVPSIPNF